MCALLGVTQSQIRNCAHGSATYERRDDAKHNCLLTRSAFSVLSHMCVPVEPHSTVDKQLLMPAHSNEIALFLLIL